MASTWTTNTAIEKIADGEKTDTWGQITNRNFDIVDRAVNGVGTVDLSSSGASHTLYTSDGSVGDALTDGMYRVLVLDGATQACTITISPNDAQKLYYVDNNSGYDCTFSQGTGNDVIVQDGTTKVIYADGAGAGAAVSALDTGLTLDGNNVARFEAGIIEAYSSVSSSSNSTTINLQDATNFNHTLTEDTTVSITNPATSGNVSAFTLKIVQDASASGYTVTWPAAVIWPNGTAPTLTTTASAIDVFVFYTNDAGSTYYGFVAGQAMG